jgi:hypothetical protein
MVRRFGFITEELELDIYKKGGREPTKNANKPSDSDLRNRVMREGVLVVCVREGRWESNISWVEV